MNIDDEDLHDEEIENLEDGDNEEGAGEADDASEQDKGQADGEEAGDEEVVAEAKKPGRGEARFQKLSNEAREAREHASRIEKELNEFKAEQARQRATAE